jgi:hypothetical protein
MKTLILAAIRCSLMFTAVAALSLAYPASVQAVPTTYRYTGNRFTDVIASLYTTSDFVTVMMTLAGPLGANMPPFTDVTPIAFTFFDGVQTLSSSNPDIDLDTFQVGTNAAGQITSWQILVTSGPVTSPIFIITVSGPFGTHTHDTGGKPDPEGQEAEEYQHLHARSVEPGHRHAGYRVYPIIDDADPYGVGSSGPAVPADSGLTAPGLARSSLLAFRHQARYIG